MKSEYRSSSSDKADIKRVMLCSGNNSLFPGIGYYGSARSTGGFSSFFEIDFSLLKIGSLPESIADEWTDEQEEVEKTEAIKRITISVHTAQYDVVESVKDQTRYLMSLDKYCLRNQDKIIPVSSPGDRYKSSKSVNFYVHDKPVFCQSRDGHCIRLSIANAIFLLEGEEKARKDLDYGPLHVQSLAKGRDWMMRDLKLYRSSRAQCEDEIDWLMQQKDGVFLIRLIGEDRSRSTNDHVACIDGSSGLLGIRYISNI